MKQLRIAWETWAAIARRWLVPLALVGGPILWANVAGGPVNVLALVTGVAVVAAIVLLAPVSWRLLFPLGTEPRRHPLRLLAYLGLGVVTVWGTSGLAGMKDALLSGDPGPYFALGLFLVAGLGLGRDVELEAGLRQQRQRVEELSRVVEMAELRAVRAHLDPHFLFNTLNAIAEWCREDPAVAERALLQLSALLREVLAAVRSERWPLDRELALVRQLGELYSIRDPERFQQEFSGDVPARDVPPMLLLAIAENAWKHGPGAGHPGIVRVEVASDSIQISNPGPFEPGAGGQGLDLVRRRVDLGWPGAAFSIGGAPRTVAQVDFPQEAT